MEYKRPAGAYPLHDFHEICRVCTPFQDVLGVKISLALLKGLRSYGGFKLTRSGYPRISASPIGETMRQTLTVGCMVAVFGRPFVKRFALCYHTVVCLSVSLSATLVYCGQTVGRIKMKLGMQIGLGPGHNVLDKDPAPLPQRSTAPNFWSISVATKWLHRSRCHLVWR